VALSPEHLGELCPRCVVELSSRRQPTPQTPEVPGFRMLRKLGEGGMGMVWLAEHAASGGKVAVKLMRKPPSAGREELMNQLRFEREVDLAKRLRHPNVARVFDAGEVGELRYFAMEFVDGPTLGDHVRWRCPNRREILQLVRTVCDAVQEAHQAGIIHRDLKPSNVLLTRDGVPKVLDFGLAKAIADSASGSTQISETGMRIGTPIYMSPEQARGDRVDTRSDVYSLGAMLYLLLSGVHPHDEAGPPETILQRVANEEIRRPRQVCPDIDAALEMLLLKSLSREPSERYRNAGELADEIAHYLEDEPLAAGRATVRFFARRWLRKRGKILLLIVLALLVNAALIFFLVEKLVAAREETRELREKIEDR
jgi:eukaryotic-like serine/threonine-protein kinase